MSPESHLEKSWTQMGTRGKKQVCISRAGQTDVLLCAHQIVARPNTLVTSPFQLATKGHPTPSCQTTWSYIPERIGSRWAGVGWGVENLIVYVKSGKNEGRLLLFTRYKKTREKKTAWVQPTAKRKHYFWVAKLRTILISFFILCFQHVWKI